MLRNHFAHQKGKGGKLASEVSSASASGASDPWATLRRILQLWRCCPWNPHADNCRSPAEPEVRRRSPQHCLLMELRDLHQAINDNSNNQEVKELLFLEVCTLYQATALGPLCICLHAFYKCIKSSSKWGKFQMALNMFNMPTVCLPIPLNTFAHLVLTTIQQERYHSYLHFSGGEAETYV